MAIFQTSILNVRSIFRRGRKFPRSLETIPSRREFLFCKKTLRRKNEADRAEILVRNFAMLISKSLPKNFRLKLFPDNSSPKLPCRFSRPPLCPKISRRQDMCRYKASRFPRSGSRAIRGGMTRIAARLAVFRAGYIFFAFGVFHEIVN